MKRKGGVMDRREFLKTGGAMIPFFRGRVSPLPARGKEVAKLTKHPLEYFKQFYGDTVLARTTSALMCGHDFFGADHMLFATDYPYPGGAERGHLAIGEIIDSVNRMGITQEEKAQIFSKNARRLLKMA